MKRKAPAAPSADVPQPAADAPANEQENNLPHFVLKGLSEEAATTLRRRMPSPKFLVPKLAPLRAAHVLTQKELVEKWSYLMSAPPDSLGPWKFGVLAQDGGDGCEVRGCSRLKAPRCTCLVPPPHRQTD